MADDPTTPPPDAKGPGKRAPRLGDLFWLGTACAVSVVGAGAIGYALDTWLGLTPWLTFAGLAFGILCAVLLTVVELRKFL
ncbi:MAG: AtpZ/AtpI family protein [Acidimicrobiales bacterium]